MKLLTAVLSSFAVASAASAATPADQAFVAKVSQGGMFEVQAGKLAADRASAQDVRDYGVMESHDHMGVGDRLKTAAGRAGITFPAALNAEFSGKLAQLKTLSGPAFDQAYMQAMADIHAKDGAAFAKEASTGGSPDLRAFAAESRRIVQRHVGAIDALPPGR